MIKQWAGVMRITWGAPAAEVCSATAGVGPRWPGVSAYELASLPVIVNEPLVSHAWRITSTLSSQGQAFADDTMLIADSHVGLQALSSATHEFLSFFCIDMAAQKSFHSSNSPDPPQHLYYGNEIIPFVDASVPVKYLGFHIAIDLN